VQAAEPIAAGVQEAKRQLGELEAARNELDSAGKMYPKEGASGAVLEAHKQLLDLEMKQQKELAAREAELQEARGQIASLKADVEKLQAAAKQRDGELANRTKERESLETKSREELTSMRSQLDKLEASLGAERKDREKAAADAKRLEEEKQKLETELRQTANARGAASEQRTKDKEAEKSASGEQLTALHSQVEKLQASIAEERKEREKAQGEVKRLEDERQKLETKLAQQTQTQQTQTQQTQTQQTQTQQTQTQQTQVPQPAEKQEEVVLPQGGTGADGSRIKKWQKPDGTLFFGERAPPGSKLLGEVENMGTSGGGESQGVSTSR
jgi:chromosome segregation ATPase